MALNKIRGFEDSDLPERDERVVAAIKRAQKDIEELEKDREISRDSAIRAFQMRLTAAMAERGWLRSDLARACERVAGRKFGRDVIGTYLKDQNPNFPRPANMEILARALGVDKEILFPSRERLRLGVDRRNPTAEVTDAGDGLAWLKINQAVEWSVALEIMKILKEGDAK